MTTNRRRSRTLLTLVAGVRVSSSSVVRKALLFGLAVETSVALVAELRSLARCGDDHHGVPVTQNLR